MKKVQKLTREQEIEITPTSPFHFNATFYKPGHFPSSDTKWEPGKRWQTMLWRGEKLGLIYEDSSAKSKSKVRVKIFSLKTLTEDFLESLKQEIIWKLIRL